MYGAEDPSSLRRSQVGVGQLSVSDASEVTRAGPGILPAMGSLCSGSADLSYWERADVLLTWIRLSYPFLRTSEAQELCVGAAVQWTAAELPAGWGGASVQLPVLPRVSAVRGGKAWV